ncbi:starch synthase [Rhizomicrobium palustre]|uniref:Glycogen synthase n=1 Tax=Rhizomicrobium palustre TaxID=189966 RepID=A0A846MZL7_9PROT|nr:glycogen synthase GlgA [Rhizomicrobium palustre]NIK88452.1 starch synthase [Rhizomicrobium palustre]
MRVLFATAEAYPLAKTGGLADVSGALPLALRRLGLDVRLVMPAYPSAFMRIEKPRIIAKIPPLLGIADATLVEGKFPGSDLPVYLIDSHSLFRRPGGLYQDEAGAEWPDNPLRFAYLAHVSAALAMNRLGISWRPDIVHANDWHAGLVPFYLSLEEAERPATIFTTHNMAFQGNFSPEWLSKLRLPRAYFQPGGIEFYNQISFLKAGIRYADRVTTVSPTYAREILTPEFGCGMEGVLKLRGADFSGILNGIDDALWNPASDPALPHHFHASDISGKRACKAALQEELGLPLRPDVPLIGFVSRITHQKMADVILEALPWLCNQDTQFVSVGEGDPKMEAGFDQARELYSHRCATVIGYDEAMAHRLQAAADILLAPARFEPCGLTQLYALKYGTLPIVRRTGGLADTVVDASAASIADRSATGFVFDKIAVDDLKAAITRALTLYREPLTWRRLQLQAMAQDFSWDASATQYAALYSAASGIAIDLGDRDQHKSVAEPETTRQAAV